LAAKKSKFYVVWKGRNPGIYDNWDDCKTQVSGYDGAQYRSYENRTEALKAFQEGYKTSRSQKATTSSRNIPRSGIIKNSISVDAACSGNPGMMEYRGVVTTSGQQLFHQGPYRDGTNNIGEFLALVHALAALKKQGKEDVTIYSDSKTAISWVRKGKANTKLEHTGHNEPVFRLIERAEQWLAVNTFKNPIVKWETESWGEIPADFGRK